MLREIGLIIALLTAAVSLHIIYAELGLWNFLLIIGVLVLEMCVITTRRVGLGWGKAFFLCFIISPVLVVLEALILYSFI